MVIKIKQKFYVSPVEAFQIVGQESYGSDWDPECISDRTSELHRTALNNLYLAMQSDQVRAIKSNGTTKTTLSSQEIAGEFFEINLKKNCIHLSNLPGVPYLLTISSNDLVAFLQSNGENKSHSTIKKETDCKNWLIDLFSDGKKFHAKEELYIQAKKRFPGISRKAFYRARLAAIEKTGRTDLNKSGRRKSLP